MAATASARRPARGTQPDRGSQVAEWSLVAGLAALVFALALQAVFALHVRNVLIDAASHGARYGTLADRGPADAEARTRELITDSVGARFAVSVRATVVEVDGAPTLRLDVSAPLPLLGPLGAPGGLEVSGHAVDWP